MSIHFFDVKKWLVSDLLPKTDSVKNIIEKTKEIEEKINEINKEDAITNHIDTLKIASIIKPLQIGENFVSKIEYPNNNLLVLKSFFDALMNARNKSTHILYYGDSQIEEDRFSGFLREQLQKHYGGSGCGLLSFMPVTQWIYPKINYSDTWIKWSCYASSPKKSQIYGPMAQSFVFDASKGNGKISIKCNNKGEYACLFNRIKLFYGYASEPILVHYFNEKEKILSDTLNHGGKIAVKEFAVEKTEAITFYFEGFESPVFYGISLESYDKGVYVDNISLRGSSGTFFHLLSKEVLIKFFEQQNVSLIILQFGGNAMPMISSEEKAFQYAQYIDFQLKTLKRVHPWTSILFVGPSDMSVNENGEMVTHPYLESVNEQLKSVVLKNKAAYFDMYRAMGGKNSMTIWVKENLAAKDYVHFSPVGARKIAALIYYSLMKDFSEYEKTQKGI